MFYGRKKELNQLNTLYSHSTFDMAILYGRRRIGKTSLLKEFYKDKSGIFHLSEEKNDQLNIESFCKKVYAYFNVPGMIPLLQTWNDIFSFLSEQEIKHRLILIIDEFPYLALENKSLMSKLQHVIDHEWKDKNIMLVLCGSSVSFMENEILGIKSPLYGRRTAQIKLEPFDYLESSLFYPNYSLEDKIIMYSIFGGIPQYLSMILPNLTVKENICNTILQPYSYLYDEPSMLLKTELRNPSVYNSILSVIGNGATKLNDISHKIHEEPAKCSKYMQTLIHLGIIERKVPLGEKEKSRNTIYQIHDPFFHFWYRFISNYQDSITLMEASVFYENIIEPNLNAYIGLEFEKICIQFITKKNYSGELPLQANRIGRWWGTNKFKKCEEDVDILLYNDSSAMFSECKWRNTLFDCKELTDLIDASLLFDFQDKYYTLFSKSGFNKAVLMQAKLDKKITLYTLKDLYNIE